MKADLMVLLLRLKGPLISVGFEPKATLRVLLSVDQKQSGSVPRLVKFCEEK